MLDREVDGRALQLFEEISERPDRRAALLATEAPAVVAALAALEDAASRARAAFPTEDDARPRRRPMPLPDRIGAYRLVAPLGEGGMGLVFVAERCDGLFEHRVAIKLIHPDRFSERALARFADERRLLARFSHPDIARLHDGGVTEEGWPYIVMELIDGVPIDQAAAALPALRDRAALVRQACEAVTAAHAALVIHGDIKPANVLVDRHGRIRLVDFGIARLVDAPADDLPLPVTTAFASPAQRSGAAPQVTDDIFSLGMLLRATLAAGGGEDHLAVPAERDLAAIAAKATAEDPAARYRSVDALADDLARWGTGRTVGARRATPLYVLRRFLGRHRRAAALTAGAGLLLTALATLSIVGWRTAQQRTALAEARTGELRELAHYQLFVIAARLEHQPRSAVLRRELVGEAEAVLANAVAGSRNNRALRIEAAQGYRLLAAVEGAPDRPSLGNTAAAASSLGKGFALVAADPSADARAVKAQILLDRAALAGWGGRVDEALRLLSAARAATPAGNGALALDIALLRADTLIWNGQYAQAAALARSVSARLSAPGRTLEHILRRDRASDRLAEATYYLGDLPGALAAYRRAARDLEAAQARQANEPAIVWALARQRWNIGVVLIDAGRAAEALVPLTQARTATAAQAADDPDDQVTQRRLRSYDLALAQANAALGRYGTAVNALEANIAARRRWQERAPAATDRSRDLAIAVAALGDVYAAAGARAAACRRYLEVRAIHARLAAHRRLSRLDASYFGGLVAASMTKLSCPGAV